MNNIANISLSQFSSDVLSAYVDADQNLLSLYKGEEKHCDMMIIYGYDNIEKITLKNNSLLSEHGCQGFLVIGADEFEIFLIFDAVTTQVYLFDVDSWTPGDRGKWEVTIRGLD